MNALRLTLPLLLAVASLAPAAPAAPAARGQDEGLRWEDHTGRAHDGSPLAGRLGRLSVPENRSVEDGPTIELAFVVYRTAHPEPAPPVIYLAGGPGASGIEHCTGPATDPRIALLETRDVIGLDQRGTGLTRPDLSAGPEFGFELPLDEPLTRESFSAAHAEAAARCFAHWSGQGVDLSAYNTVESADDIEALRRALGLERVALWGESYGSHLALAYLRRHGEHVERALLSKVEGPDQTFKLPSALQRQLERLHERVASDPRLSERLPDLTGTLRGVLEQLAQDPVTVSTSRGGQELSVVLGPYDVQLAFSNALGFSQTRSGMPAALYMMSQGEWRHMLGFALRTREGSIGSPMGMMMDCASGASPERRARIERERLDPANLLGDAIAWPFYPSTCEACGSPDLGEAFRGPLECDVPVLFVSGELDGRTPPENVEEIRAGFTDAAHVRVTNTGHDSRELESEEFRELLRAFLVGLAIVDLTIELPPVPLQPIPGG